MKLATILPVKYLHLEQDNDYHMALAHLVPRSADYAGFFKARSARGDHVIMDNGIVEGDQRPTPELVASAEEIGATEIILPDEIGDAKRTLAMGSAAIEQMKLAGKAFMAVPQGSRVIEWERCLDEMLTWPVATIGFSKFIHQTTQMSRLALVDRWSQEVIDSGKQIHLLGSPAGADEFRLIAIHYPLVRGADSGYPTFCTAGWQKVRRDGRRPEKAEVDWLDGSELDVDLMAYNYHAWRRWTLHGTRPRIRISRGR